MKNGAEPFYACLEAAIRYRGNAEGTRLDLVASYLEMKLHHANGIDIMGVDEGHRRL